MSVNQNEVATGNVKTNSNKVGLSRKAKRRIFIACMLAIPITHFFVFWLWVNIDGIFLAFQNNVGTWIGLKNFEWVYNSFIGGNLGLDMWEATRNTLIFFAWNTLIETPIAVVLAYVFFKKIPGNKFFTICLYLPSIITGTVMTTVFKAFVGGDGPIAVLCRAMGEKWVYPITQESTALISMLVYAIWTGYGLNIILFRSAMNRIPKEIFESAALDGITMKEELTKIIIPLIWPMVATMIILAVAGMFGSSGPVLLFTNGDYGTMTISHAMYLQYREYGQIARAATIGLIYTIIGLPLVFITRWASNKIGGEYEY